MNWITIFQNLASKKFGITAFAIYMLNDLAVKNPVSAPNCIYITAGLAALYMVGQTILDWKNGNPEDSKK